MPLKTTHLRASDYRTMPWKNGGGSTTEIAIYPAQASVSSDFSWRLSLAQLDGSGPFSTFPGYDRVIIQISGKPMRLKHPQAEVQLAALTPYSFQGEWPTEAIVEGQAEDFNLMVRREEFESNFESLRIADGHSKEIAADDVLLIWVFHGECEWHHGSQKAVLKRQEALIVEAAVMPSVLKSRDSIVFVASLSRT